MNHKELEQSLRGPIIFRRKRRYPVIYRECMRHDRSDRRYQHFFKKLAPFVKDWQWSDVCSADTTEMAKKDLEGFVQCGKKLLSKAKRYNFEPLSVCDDGIGYVSQMMAVKRCLDDQRWDLACHELYDVIYSFRIQDRRVLYTIIRLVEGYL